MTAVSPADIICAVSRRIQLIHHEVLGGRRRERINAVGSATSHFGKK